jgi:hypothetical protein
MTASFAPPTLVSPFDEGYHWWHGDARGGRPQATVSDDQLAAPSITSVSAVSSTRPSLVCLHAQTSSAGGRSRDRRVVIPATRPSFEYLIDSLNQGWKPAGQDLVGPTRSTLPVWHLHRLRRDQLIGTGDSTAPEDGADLSTADIMFTRRAAPRIMLEEAVKFVERTTSAGATTATSTSGRAACQSSLVLPPEEATLEEGVNRWHGWQSIRRQLRDQAGPVLGGRRL